MCGKCGVIAGVYWSRSLSWMFCQRCSSKDRNPAFERTSTLPGSTRRAVCISNLQNTSNFHPDRPGPVEPALTSESFWPFTEAFQGSALPLGHGSVCRDEVVFPGYWKTRAGWFIKETSASYKLLRCQTSGSSSSNIRRRPGFLELDLIMSPSIVKVGICYCQYLLPLCHPAQQNPSFYIWLA